MIHPTDEQLLAGIAEALKDTVLPQLARDTAARKQLQAAIEILRRIAFALPGEAETLEADNADMAEVIDRIKAVLSAHSPPPNPPPSRGRGNEFDVNTSEKRLPPSDQRSLICETQTPPSAAAGGRPEGPGGGDLSASSTERNGALQAKLTELQASIPPDLSAQITPLLTSLYKRMTDRALAQLPPPVVRTPGKSP